MTVSLSVKQQKRFVVGKIEGRFQLQLEAAISCVMSLSDRCERSCTHRYQVVIHYLPPPISSIELNVSSYFNSLG